MMASRHSSTNSDFRTRNLRDSKQNNGVEEEETVDDRIGQLPDALLVEILSLLPTKDAVASCVLSKRWRYLWNSIHSFLFINRYCKKVENFISFVDHVLAHSTCSKIKKFQLSLTRISEWVFDSSISEWLSFAVENKVEYVALYSSQFARHLSYELPLSMYTCSSLITLHLSCWAFDREMVISWNSLKSLKLEVMWLEDDDIMKLLSSCPALETMELELFQGFRRLEITSSNLKRLKLKSYSGYPYEEPDKSLEILAPHLQHLEITGNLGDLKCKLVNVSSLVTATLTFSNRCITEVSTQQHVDCRDYHQVFRNLVLEYLQKLSHVTQLKIGSWLEEVLFMLQLEGVPLPELRCKCLKIEMNVTKKHLYGLASLLRTSPILETLNIQLGIHFFDYFHCLREQNYLDKGDDINLQSWTSNIVFSSLMNVNIVGDIAACLKDWSEGHSYKLFDLLKFILKNAIVLKKFVIVAKRTICGNCSESCVSRYLLRLAKELLDSPRSSKDFVIIYQESALHD